MSSRSHTDPVGRGRKLLYKLSGAAGLIVAVLLVGGAKLLVLPLILPGAATAWLSAFPDNWLVVIFKLHAGFPGAQIELLRGIDWMDLLILALVAVLYLGLYAALRNSSRIWAIVAAIQPLLGIGLFLVTEMAGRSAVMGAALVISLVMLRSRLFPKAAANLGIVASILLWIGDLTAGVIPPGVLVASLVGVGYVLLIAWFVLVGYRLWRLASDQVLAGQTVP